MTALSAEKPFPGLRPYAFPDRDYFFGREDQSFALYRLVTMGRFVAVVGASGGGKSSLVRAGLRGLLADETETQGGNSWQCIEMRPGLAPLARLAEALATLAGDSDMEIAKARQDRVQFRLRQSSFGLEEALPEIGASDGKSILLVVDQFEELFRFGFGEIGGRRDRTDAARRRDEAAQFVQLLLDTARRKVANIHVLIAMRSDFIGECAHFHGLPAAVSAMQYLVPNLTRDQLEDTIRKPIDKAGAEIEPALVERLINDLDEEADPLPVLQHSLMRLWNEALKNNSTPRKLTAANYDAIGGLQNALSRHADEILAELEGRELAVEQLMRALAQVDREGRATRRWLAFSQAWAETGVEEQDLRIVCDRFRSEDCSFLTPPVSVALTEDTVLDFGHEAILRRWKKVAGDPDTLDASTGRPSVGWLRDEERDGQRYRALLSMLDANGNGSPPANIQEWSDWWNRRPRTAAWAERYGGQFASAKRLIEQGVAAKAQEEHAAQERKRERRKTRRRIVGLSVALALALVYLGLSIRNAFLERQIQSENDENRLKAAQTLLNQVLNEIGSGQIQAKGADDLSNTIETLVANLGGRLGSRETRELRVNLLIVESDIAASGDKKPKVFDLAKKAEDIASTLIDAREPTTNDFALLYASRVRVGDALSGLRPNPDQIQPALEAYRRALESVDLLKASAPAGTSWRADRLDVQLKIADLYQDARDASAAIKLYRDSLAIAENLVGDFPNDDRWRRERGKANFRLGRALHMNGDLTEAKERLFAAQSDQEYLASKKPQDSGLQSNLSSTRARLADLLIALNQPEEAVIMYRGAIGMQEALTRSDPSNIQSKLYLAPKYVELSRLLDRLGRPDEARRSAGDAYSLCNTLWDADHPDVNRADTFAAAAVALGNHQNDDERFETKRQALAAWLYLVRSNSSGAYLKAAFSDAMTMADEFEAKQKWIEAKDVYEVAAYVVRLNSSGAGSNIDWLNRRDEVARRASAVALRLNALQEESARR